MGLGVAAKDPGKIVASRSIHAEESSPNICHQLLDPSRNHSGAPPPQETFQDQQAGLLQAPVESLLLSSILAHRRFCAIPLRVKSLSPPALWRFGN